MEVKNALIAHSALAGAWMFGINRMVKARFQDNAEKLIILVVALASLKTESVAKNGSALINACHSPCAFRQSPVE